MSASQNHINRDPPPRHARVDVVTRTRDAVRTPTRRRVRRHATDAVRARRDARDDDSFSPPSTQSRAVASVAYSVRARARARLFHRDIASVRTMSRGFRHVFRLSRHASRRRRVVSRDSSRSFESRPQRTKGAHIFMCPHFYETTHP